MMVIFQTRHIRFIFILSCLSIALIPLAKAQQAQVSSVDLTYASYYWFCSAKIDNANCDAAVLAASDTERRDALDDAPWPVLADGRRVIDIFSHRLALAACETCMRDITFEVYRHEAGGMFLTWGEIVKTPSLLRRALVGAFRVSLKTGNQIGIPGLLFGRYARDKVPTSQTLTLTIFARPFQGSDCMERYGPLSAPPCGILFGLAKYAEYADSAGYVVNNGSFYGGTDSDTLYVSADTTHNSSIGLPSYFICNFFLDCANALNANEGPGYLMASDIGLSFDISKHYYEENQWFEVQKRWMSIFEDMILY